MTGAPRNILFIFSDQHAQRIAGPYGDRIAETPALDRLAGEGVTFDNCYTPAPVCGPARMAMLSGRPPHETRTFMNNDILPSHIPTYANALAAHGVDTALAGRLHAMGPDQMRGFARRIVGDHSPAWPGVARHDMGILARTHGPNRISLERSGAGNSAYQNLDEASRDAAIAELEARAARLRAGETRPFFLKVGFMLPHPPFVARAEDYARFEGRVPPPRQPAPPNDEHPYLAWWRRNREIETVPPDERDRSRAAFYGLVHRLDRYVDALLGALDRLGLADDTLVVYASDHGEHLGERGLWWKHTFFDEAVKVPLLMRWPGRLPAGVRRPQLVDLMDVAATFVDAAGAPPLPNGRGRSLLPIAGEAGRPWVDRVFSQNCVDAIEGYSGGRAMQQRMLREGGWKLVYHHGLPPQLFDLETDPDETNDRADDPAVAERLAAMTSRILDGWDPEAIGRLLEQRMADKRLLRAWAEVASPEDPIRWRFDPDINRLDDPQDQPRR